MTSPYAQAYDGLNGDEALFSPDVRLFLEGVQIPFSSISLIEQRGQLPQLNVELPPDPCFIKIGRSYQPKVHLFVNEELCFNGFMAQVNYDVNAAAAQSSTTFTAYHKFQHLAELEIHMTQNANTSDYIDAVTNTTGGFSTPQTLLGEAMLGVSQGGTPVSSATPSGNITSVPAYAQGFVSGRWEGYPGTIICLWNILKKSAYLGSSEATAKHFYQAMRDIYIPLLEQGLQFFLGLSGHNVIEASTTEVTQCIGQGIKVSTAYAGLINNSLQATLLLNNPQGFMGNAPATANFWELCNLLMQVGGYELQVLAKPAFPGLLAAGSDVYSQGIPVETVAHPELPFYYAPQCNVVYPNQLVGFGLNFNNYATPTHLVGYIPAVLGTNSTQLSVMEYMRAPNSFREAMSRADNNIGLGELFQKNFGAAGFYEYGQGCRPTIFEVPDWIYLLYSQLTTDSASSPTQNSFSSTTFTQAASGIWLTLHPTASGNLNPFDPSAWSTGNGGSDTVTSLGTMLMLADYEFAKDYMKTRTSQVSVLFNTNYVVGYPAMVVDPTPGGLPHLGNISSVVHTITPETVNTQLNLEYVYTLEELGRFQVPPLQPYLMFALGFSTIPSLLANTQAHHIANTFYQQVLGVGAVAPDHVYNFTEQQVYDGGQQNIVSVLAQGSRPGVSISQAELLYGTNFILKEELESSNSSVVTAANVYKQPQNPYTNLYEFGESQHILYQTARHPVPCHEPDLTSPAYLTPTS